jgi:hypothetical protein
LRFPGAGLALTSSLARYHSIGYDITRSAAFEVVPIICWQMLYVILVGVPLLIAPVRGFAFFGLAVLLAAAVSHIFYWYAFASVWCFFAALLSLYLCFCFGRLPLPSAALTGKPRGNAAA